jgi:hypothetical protein
VLDDDALDDEATDVTRGRNGGDGLTDDEGGEDEEDSNVEVALHVDHDVIIPLQK